MSTRTRTLQTTLEGTVVRPSRSTLATSQEIRDRGSAFVGYIYRATTAAEARATMQYHHQTHARDHAQRKHKGRNKDGDETKEVTLEADAYYTMAAWRCMVVKPGRTGLGGPEEFEVDDGYDDGGEKWAGKRILGVMQHEGVIDAVVIVSRWFGGTLLGPARFTHIEICSGEVCRRFKKIEEMEECTQALNTLDDLLVVLRAELAAIREKTKRDEDTNPSTSNTSRAVKTKAPDYRAMQESLDLTKAKSLIHARECAIKNTKTLIEMYKATT